MEGKKFGALGQYSLLFVWFHKTRNRTNGIAPRDEHRPGMAVAVPLDRPVAAPHPAGMPAVVGSET